MTEFVWRFTNADRSQQGFDLTALPVGSEGDRDSFLNSIKSHVCLQLSLDLNAPGNDLNEEVNRHYDPAVITRLTVGGCDVWVSRPLWVRTPSFETAPWVIGVSTVTRSTLFS